MQDTELYRHLLGIEDPWSVGRVELNLAQQRVDVWAEHAADRKWSCTQCGKLLSLYDHSEERVWRHLDSCQFMTYLHARPPRVHCPEHGVRQVELSWAQPRSRFTVLFERFALQVLRQTDVSGATRILRISWDEAWALLERAVERGLKRKRRGVVRRIGIDEKASAKHHRYISVVCDLDRGTVEYIGEDRREASLDWYFNALTEEQRQGIEAIAMDMWDPFVAAVRTHVPEGEAKIVYDRFHVMKHMGDAVNEVRKREHRQLQAAGDETLAGSRFLWLYAEENLPDRHRERFARLKATNLKTGRAWAIKESLRDLWSCRSRNSALQHWKRWHFWATHSRLPAVIDVARMVRLRLANVLRYYSHRITNAVSEGLNSNIQTIKKMAYGFRNRDHFKAAIYFHCGGPRPGPDDPRRSLKNPKWFEPELTFQTAARPSRPKRFRFLQLRLSSPIRRSRARILRSPAVLETFWRPPQSSALLRSETRGNYAVSRSGKPRFCAGEPVPGHRDEVGLVDHPSTDLTPEVPQANEA